MTHTLSDEQIAPCPFCSGEAATGCEFGMTRMHYYGRCRDCGARGQSFPEDEGGKTAAIAAWNRRAILSAAAAPGGAGEPTDIRAAGWTVAVHNDYRLTGEQHTFWLFTKNNTAIKGEGRTDAEALNQVRFAIGLAASPAAPVPAADRWTEAEIHAREWWCPHCRKEVPPEMVTKDGEHYLESGGCGRPVRGELIDSAAAMPPAEGGKEASEPSDPDYWYWQWNAALTTIRELKAALAAPSQAGQVEPVVQDRDLHSHMMVVACRAAERRASKEVLRDVCRAIAADKNLRAKLATPPAGVQGDAMEHVASQWDGCFYENAIGGDIDIGAAIRESFDKFMTLAALTPSTSAGADGNGTDGGKSDGGQQ